MGRNHGSSGSRADSYGSWPSRLARLYRTGSTASPFRFRLPPLVPGLWSFRARERLAKILLTDNPTPRREVPSPSQTKLPTETSLPLHPTRPIPRLSVPERLRPFPHPEPPPLFPAMRKTLYCGVDLHSNNAMYVITDEKDKQLFHKRLPKELPVVFESLAPFRPRLKVVAVESTYNWYWLIDGLQEREYPVVLAHPQVQWKEEGPQQRQERPPVSGVGLRGGGASRDPHVPPGEEFLRPEEDATQRGARHEGAGGEVE